VWELKSEIIVNCRFVPGVNQGDRKQKDVSEKAREERIRAAWSTVLRSEEGQDGNIKKVQQAQGADQVPGLNIVQRWP
jgi:hypothetical protein